MFFFHFSPFHLSIVISELFFRNLTIKTSNKHIHVTNTITGGPIHGCRCVRISCMADVFEHYYFMNFLCTFWFVVTPYTQSLVCNMQYTLHTTHGVPQSPFELNVISLFLFQHFSAIRFRIRFLLLKTS